METIDPNARDLTGQIFGQLTVLAWSGVRQLTHNNLQLWLCRCSCGKEVIKTNKALLWVGTRSCGCKTSVPRPKTPPKPQSTLINLKGKKFHKLLVLEREGSVKLSKTAKCSTPAWKCLCDCGTILVVAGKSLKRGKVKSCGCSRHLEKKGSPHKQVLGKGQRGGGAFNMLYSSYRKDAQIRNYAWELTYEEFGILTKRDCFYCGSKPSRNRKFWRAGVEVPEKSYTYNGIDRWCNEQGYCMENCVTACFICNRAKGALSGEDFFDWIIRIHKNITEVPA